ncbi:hypothetical protein L195_g032722, partial [Trifolium pratense]
GATSILDVPLFDVVEEDKLVWYDNAHGNYSLKSGYNMMMKSTRSATYDSPSLQEDWKWRLEGKTSTSWCVRDYMGEFKMDGTSWIQGNCSIIEGEAIALLEAMKELD